MILGLVLVAVALGVRGTTVNRHIRRRAFVSAVLFASDAALIFVLAQLPLDPDLARSVYVVATVCLTVGIINLLVTAVINPWRADRLPDHFPTIVQDSIIMALFAVVAAVFLRGEFLATTAVGAVVVGLALQETLGNLFAGLALEIEKPFRVGHWVAVGDREGVVTEVTWRATKVRTKAGNLIIVPNSVVARDRITNYSEPTTEVRLELEVGASYDTPPNEVKAVIRAALADDPRIDQKRGVDVLLAKFDNSAILYRVRTWTTDFAEDERILDGLRSRIYYAFRRQRIVIPYPIQVEIDGDRPPAVDVPPRLDVVAVLRGTRIFATLSDRQLANLADGAHVDTYGAGETIVREGVDGSSMFVLVRGEAGVTIAGSSELVARLAVSDFFGEMSLLTGATRSATVAAVTDCELVEITAERFREIAAHDPSILDGIVDTVTTRRAELDRHRAGIPADAQPPETAPTFLTHIRRFLRLSVTP